MSSTASDGRHSRAQGRHDDRPVDQDRMRDHEIDQLVVAPFRIVKAELVVGRALPAQADRVARSPWRWMSSTVVRASAASSDIR